MKIISTFFGVLFGVALLAALLTGGYFLFRYIVSVFNTLEPQFETLATIASIVAVLCAVIIAEGLKARSQNEYLAIVSVEKAKIYEALLSFLIAHLKMQEKGDVLAVDAELVKFEQLLALHGSAKLITAYINLRRFLTNEKIPGNEASELFKKLLVEMRADLGRTEFNLNKKDLLNLLLKPD